MEVRRDQHADAPGRGANGRLAGRICRRSGGDLRPAPLLFLHGPLHFGCAAASGAVRSGRDRGPEGRGPPSCH